MALLLYRPPPHMTQSCWKWQHYTHVRTSDMLLRSCMGAVFYSDFMRKKVKCSQYFVVCFFHAPTFSTSSQPQTHLSNASLRMSDAPGPCLSQITSPRTIQTGSLARPIPDTPLIPAHSSFPYLPPWKSSPGTWKGLDPPLRGSEFSVTSKDWKLTLPCFRKPTSNPQTFNAW